MINYDKEAITESTYKHVDAILKSNDYLKNNLGGGYVEHR